jgi:hypothetical protein
MFTSQGYFHELPEENDGGWYPTLNSGFQTKEGPIRVRKVSVDISLDQFFGYFKQFNLVLQDDALNITDREYEIIE